MEILHLQAKVRDVFGKKNKTIRDKGLIPAVVYGKTIKPISLVLSAKEFRNIYKRAGDNTIIELDILDEKSNNHVQYNVLIQDVTTAPVSGEVMHIDFHAVAMNEKVKAYIPVEFIGENDLLKTGGTIIKSLNEIEVEALPQFLPHKIEVDISRLQSYGDTLYVRDLNLGPDVKILIDDSTPIATLAEPTQETPVEKETEAVTPGVEATESSAVEAQGENKEKDELK